MNLADCQWLVGPEAATLLEDIAQQTMPLHRLTTSLRRDHSAERVHLLIEQAELRRRAIAKFPHAERMFFTQVGLEQATDAWTATYKVHRFSPGATVADLCCGIGGDLAAIGAQCRANAVDRSEVMLCLANANATTLQLNKPQLLHASAEDVAIEEFAAWHIDPDRRPAGRRTTQVATHSPPVEVLDQLQSRQPNAAIKLAPATEPPLGWIDQRELEWISRGGECKQLMAWSGDLTTVAGQRRATALAPNGDVLGTMVGVPGSPAPVANGVGEAIYEPDAAVFAAGLDGALAEEWDLQRISTASGYLTGPSSANSPLLAKFAVEESMPLRVKALASYFRSRGVGRLEIKSRGVQLDIPRLRGQLKLTGDAEATLIVTRRGKQAIAVIAQRVNEKTNS